MACSPEDLEKFSVIAKDEIGETGVDLKDAMENVKSLVVAEYENFRPPPNIDEIVERSLRSRKFDVAGAAKQIHLYFNFLADMRALHKEMYFLPSILQEYFFESMGVNVLKRRDSKGRVVMISNFETLPAKTYNVDKGIAACILLIDELTRTSVDTQRLGIVFVCNLAGYEFGHAKQYTFSRLRSLTRLMQGSFPVRYKGFHLINNPAIFTYTFAVLKPLLREKIRSRVFCHGHDLTEFHKHISPDILPKPFGGTLSNEESVDFEFTRRLGERDEYYHELFKYGYMNDSSED